MFRIELNGSQIGVRMAPAGLENRFFQGGERALNYGLVHAVGISMKDFLSGPRPTRLDVRSTRLRNSITHRVDRTADGIEGRIGTNVTYARIHEMGFRGTVNVRAHTRIVDQKNAKGESFDGREAYRDANSQFIGYKSSSRRRSTRQQKDGIVLVQFVRAHQRKLNYAGKPFLAPALEQATPILLDRLAAEVADITT